MTTDNHPIDPEVRADIQGRLEAIERSHGVRVLYACESGSRGWGFASPDSDYDVRFIYVHPLPWYLTLSPQRDVIEQPISERLDISGWELRKALGLLQKGNATLVEWLDSPVTYRADAAFLQAMRDAARATHRPDRAFHHYVQMARRTAQDLAGRGPRRLKRYLYALRALLATLWIEQGRGSPPMPLQTLVETLVTDPALRQAIESLADMKRAAREADQIAPVALVDDFIEQELRRLKAVAPPRAEPSDASLLDRLLLETVLADGAAGQDMTSTTNPPPAEPLGSA